MPTEYGSTTPNQLHSERGSFRSRSRCTQSRTLCVLRRRQARRRRSRLLLRLRHDRSRCDAAQPAGRWPSADRSRHKQRGCRLTSRAHSAKKGFARRPRVGASGDLRVHHQASDRAAITGDTPDGEPIKGDYKFTDEFPMADGFEENVEFFTLDLRGAAARRVATASSPRSRRCCGCGPAPAAGASTTSRRGGTSPTRTACSRTSTRRKSSSRRSPTNDDVATRVHRHRRGPAVRVDVSRAARPRRAGAPLRGVPAQLRDRVRAGRAVKFTLKAYQAEAVDDVLQTSSARDELYHRDGVKSRRSR